MPGPGPASSSPLFFLAAFLAAFFLYWRTAVQGRFPWTLRGVLALGVLIRLALLPMTPSDDMARYLWEGRMITEGINPYRYAPADTALEALRDADGDGLEDAAWSGINHAGIPAIYPPLAMGFFGLLAAIHPSALLFKSAFLLLDAAGLALLLAAYRSKEGPAFPGAPTRERLAALYFLNPLLMLEVAGHGHFESLPLLFSIAFLAALRAGRPKLAVLALFLGAAGKIAALALLPVLLLHFACPASGRKGGARGWSAGLLACSAVMLPLIALLHSTGCLPNLVRFASGFRYNDLVPWLLRLVLGGLVPDPALRAATLALLAGCGLFLLGSMRTAPPERRALSFMALFLAFSPTVHPWYGLWLLPFAAPLASRPFLLLTGTLAAAYGVHARAGVTGKWREIPWLRLPEYLPPALLWLRERIARRGRKPA